MTPCANSDVASTLWTLKHALCGKFARRTRNFFHTIVNSDSDESSDEENGTCGVTAVTVAVPLAGEKDADSDWEEYEYDDMCETGKSQVMTDIMINVL